MIEVMDKLPDETAINASEVLRKELDELRGHVRNVSYQLECMRSLQQIENDLREIRGIAASARFAEEGEPGFIPKQSLGDDRWFTVSFDESKARTSTIRDFGYIEERLDSFILCENDGNMPALSFNLDDFQKTVRQEARKSVEHSLNEVALSGRFLIDQLHEMLGRIAERNKEHERSREIEEKIQERARGGQPINLLEKL